MRVYRSIIWGRGEEVWCHQGHPHLSAREMELPSSISGRYLDLSEEGLRKEGRGRGNYLPPAHVFVLTSSAAQTAAAQLCKEGVREETEKQSHTQTWWRKLKRWLLF